MSCFNLMSMVQLRSTGMMENFRSNFGLYQLLLKTASLAIMVYGPL